MQIKILIVDDKKENLYALKVLLDELEINNEDFENLEIIEALNGEDALRIAMKDDIDLILLDIKMPVMDGFEVTEFLKSTEKTKNIPIVFMTAEFKSDEFMKRGYKMGALDYFTKPIERFSFLNKIKLYIALFLAQKKQKRQFDYTLHQYVELIDKNIITSDTDLKGNITRVSQAFCDISGYSKEELVGNSHSIVRSPDTTDNFYRKIWDKLLKNETWQGEIKDKKKNGKYYWIKTTISPRYDDKGDKIGYTSIKQDISDKKELEHISITDGLTEIFNRRYFNEILPKIINSAKRHNKLICFAIIDVDYFKKYNDIYGHQKGDEVLKEIAKTLQNSVNRADDYCFRLGGEEFGLVFNSDEKNKALSFMRKIKENVENLKIEHSGNDINTNVTISTGLTCKFGREIKNLKALYKETDELLYLSKQTGRNKITSN